MSAEDKCLNLIKSTNKPYNVQGVADMLASQGVKKAQADRALAALAEAGKIVCKEFGKIKLYIPLQEGLPELSPEDKASKMAEINQLHVQCKEADEAVANVKRALSAANSRMTTEELQAKVADLQAELEALEGKLGTLRGGAALVSQEEVTKVEKAFARLVEGWGRYKRVFRSIWDTVSENIDGKQMDLFEEIGVETDEAVGETLSDYQQLLACSKRARP